ncbi:uncharacterized protein A4U43_C01F2510 [Asparagus officinalis]|uniref:glycerophosphodiester phosphodiesterase n=1 Tax=Asparagus officinalis TaxID=4686 RepID=A0A5P1FLQ0_ASPOF|nr:glycerophosphodiester phosphodiesterase GDPDL3-like [Asparagus officinalis]ONK79062.1 uncharacterized protein A4U43_C01F2510 [Asparagus officinalis]
MWEMRFRCKTLTFVAAFLVLRVLHHRGLVTALAPKSPWLTLSGDAPVVVAKGGFSGIFPESSSDAFQATYLSGSPDTITWCGVQLTKDGTGICIPSMLLDTCTSIQVVFPNETSTYSVDGVPTSGWFSVDYDFQSLEQVSVIRSILSRSDKFDFNAYPILPVEEVQKEINSAPLWLDIQHDLFYTQHNLSMRDYLVSISKKVAANYVSSPEVGFLTGIGSRFNGSKTKLVFRFLEEDIIEPSTNQTYGSLLQNLTFIKTFASGILIPKNYIWPTSDLYLQPHTSIVLDAHKEGLEVFASEFANDGNISYNYSYDPVLEYLNFVDNGIFSVDGVLTDFPATASEAIGCFSHVKRNGSDHGKPVVITHNGASGIYPDCTDLAYQRAVEDGADFIDCPVQVTEDGVLLCMSSINLMDSTTVTTSTLRSRSSLVGDIQQTPGIFTFNLTWDEIQKNLKPAISNPELNYGLLRNPRYTNAGNFTKLSDFLAFAKGKPLSGIVISIEHAAFLAEKLEYSVTEAVIKALKDAGFNNQRSQQVMIQSTNSSVLRKFKQQTSYKCIYNVDESISNADASSLADMKKFATSVAVDKVSIYPVTKAFITGRTDLVKNLQDSGFSVFVYFLRNEYVSQPWDFFSDPIAEINAFVQDAGVDGIITEFPGTVTRYKRNTCLKLGNKMPNYMKPVSVGTLLGAVDPTARPPAVAPMPVLDDADVAEPPLPPAPLKPKVPSPPARSSPEPQPSAGSQLYSASSLLKSLAKVMLSVSFLLLI